VNNNFFCSPDNAGFAYFKYKNAHSIVLLGICDVNNIFTLIKIGLWPSAYGRRSHGGIFRDNGPKIQRETNECTETKTVDG